MELTREQAIAEHRKMWNWIADEIEKENHVFDIEELKDLYLGVFKKMSICPIERCFLCEYSMEQLNKTGNGVTCDHCPVIKADGYGCLGGLHYEVCRSYTWQEQAKLARQIANLPERKTGEMYEDNKNNDKDI